LFAHSTREEAPASALPEKPCLPTGILLLPLSFRFGRRAAAPEKPAKGCPGRAALAFSQVNRGQNDDTGSAY
jgi:hypothetical protein